MARVRVYTCQCNCEPNQSIGGGTAKTEYFKTQSQAAFRVRYHVINRHIHWAVHAGKKHVLWVMIGDRRFGGS